MNPTWIVAGLLATGLLGCSTPLDIKREDGRAEAVESAAAAAQRAAAAFHAERTLSAAELAAHLGTERARIASARTRAAERYTEAEGVCWQRFAVSDCLSTARQQRRATLAELRQQDLVLSEIERQRRTADRLRELGQREPK